VALSWWQRLVWTPRAVQLREQLTLEQLLADQGEATAAGEQITADRAVRLSTVFACTRLLSDSVAMLPLRAYRGDDQLPELPPLLRRPSADFPELSDWLWACMSSLTLRGNCFGVVTARAGAGFLPAQCDLVNPDAMAVTREPDENGTVRTVYRLSGEEIDPLDVWHVRAYPQAGSPLGLSPIGAAREAIALGIAAEKYGARYFGDASMPAGVLESDQHIDNTDARDLKERWKAAHKGHRDIAVLGAGAKFRPIAIAPEEAQFIQTQKFNVSTIARFYGIPAEMVGGETAGHEAYTSPEMRSTDYLRFTLQPWISKLERAVSRLLPRATTVKFNAGGFLRPTLKERYEAHESGIRAGWLRRSEVRALEDLPPIPGIDDPPPEPPTGAVA
jgi:HK97 family phage portal protein